MGRFFIAAAAGFGALVGVAAFTFPAPTTACAPSVKQVSFKGATLPPGLVLSTDDSDALPVVALPSAQPKQVMLGDYAAATLEWMLPIMAPILAAFLVDALIKVRQALGQNTTAAQRDQLQKMAENGVNLAAHQLGHDLTGKLPVQVKSAIMAQAVDYVQAHGAETIKALGIDPTDTKAVQAIQGRVATILSNKEAAATAPAA